MLRNGPQDSVEYSHQLLLEAGKAQWNPGETPAKPGFSPGRGGQVVSIAGGTTFQSWNSSDLRAGKDGGCMRWHVSVHVHQHRSLQRSREKKGTEADLVFAFGFSHSVNIDNALSVLSECP